MLFRSPGTALAISTPLGASCTYAVSLLSRYGLLPQRAAVIGIIAKAVCSSTCYFAPGRCRIASVARKPLRWPEGVPGYGGLCVDCPALETTPGLRGSGLVSVNLVKDRLGFRPCFRHVIASLADGIGHLGGWRAVVAFLQEFV